MSGRRIVRLNIVLEIDADKADRLPGFPGYSTALDADPPISGLEIAGDALAETLARVALDKWRTPLDGKLLGARAVVEGTFPAIVGDRF